MRCETPAQVGPLDPTWIEPLKMVERVLTQPGATVADSFFDLDDFMIMVSLVRPPRPSIVLYKHCYTRRYINLDDAGHAYRYFPSKPGSKGDGLYRRHNDLRTAVDNVGLWELPWMKAGLEHHRFGCTWDERWIVRRELERAPREGGALTASEFWRRLYSPNGRDDEYDEYDGTLADSPITPRVAGSRTPGSRSRRRTQRRRPPPGP